MEDILTAQPVLQDFNAFLRGFNFKWGTPRTKLLHTILVIDDEEFVRQSLTLLLRSLLCKIVTVDSAEEAIKYLYENSKDVVLILSDIDLPQMSGLEFLQEIKQHKVFQNIPVILQSGGETTTISKGLNLGAAGFLQKPYTKESLYEEIRKLKFL